MTVDRGEHKGSEQAGGAPLTERKGKRQRRHHTPELMITVKIMERGKLLRHTIAFAHNCEERKEVVDYGNQEQLPW